MEAVAAALPTPPHRRASNPIGLTEGQRVEAVRGIAALTRHTDELDELFGRFRTFKEPFATADAMVDPPPPGRPPARRGISHYWQAHARGEAGM